MDMAPAPLWFEVLLALGIWAVLGFLLWLYDG